MFIFEEHTEAVSFHQHLSAVREFHPKPVLSLTITLNSIIEIIVEKAISSPRGPEVYSALIEVDVSGVHHYIELCHCNLSTLYLRSSIPVTRLQKP